MRTFRHGQRWLTFLLLILTSVALVGTPASADLADATGRDGVAGVEPGFGAKPHTSVASMETIGDRIYVGGRFTHVTRDGTFHDDQSFLAAFDATTGEYLADFSPALDGPVNAMAVYQGQLLIGGQFSTVNGIHRPALALLDPISGSRAPLPFKIHGGAPANVRGFAISDDHLYVTGSFNHAVANGVTVSVKNAARFHIPSETVDAQWLPVLDGPSWAIASDPVNGKVYAAGFMAGGLVSLDAVTGATLRAGFDGGSISKPYDVVLHRGLIWVAGAEHALFVIDAATMNVERYHYAGRAGQANPWNGGEYQALEAVGDRVYASCHCNYESYLVGEGIRRPVSYLVAFDADTGLHIPSFDPHMLARSGPWAITEGPDGCIWTGGEIRKAGAQRVDNLVRLCDNTGFGNNPVVDLTIGAATEQGLGWFEVDLGTSQPIRSVEVDAQIGDNFIIVSDRVFPNDRSGAQLAGSEGFHGTRMIESDGLNERWFNTHGRYIRIYTTTPLDPSQVRVLGRDEAGDTERPTRASQMELVASGQDVAITWEAAADNIGVAGYHVYREDRGNGVFVQIGTSVATSYVDTGLAVGDYRYYLRAYDNADNVGWRNQVRSVTVGDQPDTERPSTPRGLIVAERGANTATLSWTGSTDNVAVVGYSVYTQAGVVASSADLTTTVEDLVPGQTYEFWVRATDEAGNISWRSNRVTVTIP